MLILCQSNLNRLIILAVNKKAVSTTNYKTCLADIDVPVPGSTSLVINYLSALSFLEVLHFASKAFNGDRRSAFHGGRRRRNEELRGPPRNESVVMCLLSACY